MERPLYHGFQAFLKEWSRAHISAVLFLPTLKGQGHETFFLQFFHQTTFPGPNVHAWKLFEILSNFREVICIRIQF